MTFCERAGHEPTAHLLQRGLWRRRRLHAPSGSSRVLACRAGHGATHCALLWAQGFGCGVAAMASVPSEAVGSPRGVWARGCGEEAALGWQRMEHPAGSAAAGSRPDGICPSPWLPSPRSPALEGFGHDYVIPHPSGRRAIWKGRINPQGQRLGAPMPPAVMRKQDPEEPQ